MIDLTAYRFRVGVFNGNTFARYSKNCKRRRRCTGSIYDHYYFNDLLINIHQSIITFTVYTYIILYFLFLMCNFVLSGPIEFPSHCCIVNEVPALSNNLISYYYICILLMFKKNWKFYYCYIDTNGNASIIGLLRFCKNNFVKNRLFKGKIGSYIVITTMWIYVFNLVCITILNPSMLNPGPNNKLTIFYQNVQGLIPFSQLNESEPYLDNSKLFELHNHAFQSDIDIIVLNETWLKDSILDNELFPANNYKIFR